PCYWLSFPNCAESGLPTLMVSLLLLLLLLLLLPAPVQLWAQLEDTCQWQVVLNKYQTLGEGNERFFNQEPVSDVDKYFEELVDSPIDHEETYWGFPYFLKINFTCPGEVREGWKAERLQIEMKGAPFRRHGEVSCLAEEACVMNWYTPMPMKNGTVVMEVEISSNQVGELIGDTRYMININGFLKKDKDKLIFTLGSEVTAMTHRHFINAPSRPVWATVDQAPVLILGGIPEEKMILISDSSFRDISLVEVREAEWQLTVWVEGGQERTFSRLGKGGREGDTDAQEWGVARPHLSQGAHGLIPLPRRHHGMGCGGDGGGEVGRELGSSLHSAS
uniref:Uncharacterized protein n=1 Tax=Vombatus ursinus TaxID=29139 RepID=A0A4X2M1G0_VOMUR